MISPAQFWDRIAPKYSKTPIKDLDSYHRTLDRTRAHLNAQDNVLEIGCGTGTTALDLAANVAHITATDISPKMIEIAREKSTKDNVSFESADIETSCKMGSGYDAILAHNLLHLVEDLPAALENIHEGLRPGGIFISKSACLGDGGWYFRPLIMLMQWAGKAPFVNVMRVTELEDLIKAAGFELIEMITAPASPPSRYVLARKR